MNKVSLIKEIKLIKFICGIHLLKRNFISLLTLILILQNEDWNKLSEEIIDEIQPMFNSLRVKHKMFSPVKRSFVFDVPNIPKQNNLMFVKV